MTKSPFSNTNQKKKVFRIKGTRWEGLEEIFRASSLIFAFSLHCMNFETLNSSYNIYRTNERTQQEM